jgi:hypothetical protein
MKLTVYLLDGETLDLRPAPGTRDWMDATVDRYAYRCLPLSIANAHGWEALNPVGFSACWDGSAGADGLAVTADDGGAGLAASHFGHGILTFRMPCVIRTEPGWDLLLQGPVNRPKDAVAPLAGIVETDWSPFTVTMNWQLTRPGTVIRFAAGEPFCSFFPLRRDATGSVDPVMRPLSDDPELDRIVAAWRAGRRAANAGMLDGTVSPDDWQKHYLRGITPDGVPGPGDHRTRLRLKPFRPPGPGDASG